MLVFYLSLGGIEEMGVKSFPPFYLTDCRIFANLYVWEKVRYILIILLTAKTFSFQLRLTSSYQLAQVGMSF